MHLSAFLQFEHFTDCSIREYRSIKLSILKHLPIMLALCQHNTLAYYAFYYADIFDAGLGNNISERHYIISHTTDTILLKTQDWKLHSQTQYLS